MSKQKSRKELHLTTQETQLIDYCSKYFGTDKTTTMRILMRMGVYQVLSDVSRVPLTRAAVEMQKIVDAIGL